MVFQVRLTGTNWSQLCVAYLIEFDALFSHSGRRVLKAEDPQLRLDQVGGVSLHGGHVKHEPPEVRVEVCVGDDICRKRTVMGP